MAIIIRREPKNANASRAVACDADGRFIWRGPVRDMVMDCVIDMGDAPANAAIVSVAFISKDARFFEDDCFNEITE